eukprot:gene46889-63521_t
MMVAESGITRQQFKSIIGGSAGNLVEWYDWFAYATFSIYFAPLFFPEGDLTAQLLNTAAIFAAGFLMRPIGAWVMGIYGDKHGRKAGLTLSVLLMAGGSLAIAFAPTYAQAGVVAPTILVIARMVEIANQGATELGYADVGAMWRSGYDINRAGLCRCRRDVAF